jgi:hypothetical protein
MVNVNGTRCTPCEAKILTHLKEIRGFVQPGVSNIKNILSSQSAALTAKAGVGQTFVLTILQKAEGVLKGAFETKAVRNSVKEALRGGKLAADGTVGVTQGLALSAINQVKGKKVNSLIQAANSFQENLKNLANAIKSDPKSNKVETNTLWTSTLLSINVLIEEFSVPPYNEMPWPGSQKMPRFSWFTVMDKNGKTRAQKAASAIGVRLASFGSYLVGKNGFRSNVTKKFGSTFSGLSQTISRLSGREQAEQVRQLYIELTKKGLKEEADRLKAASDAAAQLAAGPVKDAALAAAAASAAAGAVAAGNASAAAAAQARAQASGVLTEANYKQGIYGPYQPRGGRRRTRKNRSRKNRKASRKNRK